MRTQLYVRLYGLVSRGRLKERLVPADYLSPFPFLEVTLEFSQSFEELMFVIPSFSGRKSWSNMFRHVQRFGVKPQNTILLLFTSGFRWMKTAKVTGLKSTRSYPPKIIWLWFYRFGDTIIFMMATMTIAKFNGITIKAGMIGWLENMLLFFISHILVY